MDLAKAAAVAAHRLDPVEAWPEFFKDKNASAVPSVGADMSEFEWEEASPESYAADMAAVMAAAGSSVKMRDGPDTPPPAPQSPTTPGQLEWA